MVEVLVDTINSAYVLVTVSDATPIGAFGHVYNVSVHDVYSGGNPSLLIDPQRSSISIATSTMDLNNVFAYPNPYRRGDTVGGEECVMIAGVTTEATVRIFNLYGELVKKIDTGNSFGGIKWYLDNQKGEPVANGVYIFHVEGEGHTVMGKIAVSR